jgi:hypothetical protein
LVYHQVRVPPKTSTTEIGKTFRSKLLRLGSVVQDKLQFWPTMSKKIINFAPKTCIRWLDPVLMHVFRDPVDLTPRFPTGTFNTNQNEMRFQLKVHFIILDLETKLLR